MAAFFLYIETITFQSGIHYLCCLKLQICDIRSEMYVMLVHY